MRLHLAFFLVSLHMVCLHGLSPEQAVDYSLSCLTDYLYSINCSLSVRSKEAPTFNHTYWLTFLQKQHRDLYNCSLAWNYSKYSCSFDTLLQNPQDDEYSYTFGDMDSFKITLYINSDGDISSRLLDDDFKPAKHIKPKTPCHLSVYWSSDQYHFTWESNYEDYSVYLTDDLMFELSYQRVNHQDKAITLSSTIMNITVDDSHFEAETKYRVRVRSSPNQGYYHGQWSEWGSEVNWTTHRNHVPPGNNVMSLLDGNVIIPLCVLGPMLLFLCYIPAVRMRRNTLIPTPEPYFKSLYSECKGDFKSWVVTPSSDGDFKTEETLKIDTLTDTILDKITLSPSPGPSCDSPITAVSEAALLGGPPAVIRRPPLPSSSSLVKSASLISDMTCALEIDSGCWRCSAVSLEREVHLYANEYCILSDTLGTDSKAHEEVGAEDQRSE